MTERRRGIDGEIPEQRDDEPCGCDHGWLDRDADRPVPCTRCRPHLARRALERQAHTERTYR